MSTSLYYLWPNHSNRNELALEFYKKSTARLNKFPPRANIAICFCKQGRDNLCYIFVDAGEEIWDAVGAFLKQSGCPEQQERAEGQYIPNVTINNIPKNIAAANVSLIACKVRFDGQVRELVALPKEYDSSEGNKEEKKKWWQFRK